MAIHILINPDNGIDAPYSEVLRREHPDMIEKWVDEKGNEVLPPKTEEKPVVLPTAANAVTSVNIEFVPELTGKVRGTIDLPEIKAERADYVITPENVTMADYDAVRDDMEKLEDFAAKIGLSYTDIRGQFESNADYNKYVRRDIKKKVNQILFRRERAAEEKKGK